MLGTDILRSSAQGSALGYTRRRVLHRASPLATSCLTILEPHRRSARPALAGGLDPLGVKPGGWLAEHQVGAGESYEIRPAGR
jgi:hypothetical protein